MLELANDIKRLFVGNKNAHGEFQITSTDTVKLKGKVQTVKSEPSLDLWVEHLNGQRGLGVVPIKEDSTCGWGCVDIDEYEDFDIEALSHKLPQEVILCRSKSGGAHLFLFMTTPAPAALVRKKLMIIARCVGHPDAEIFPKQEFMNEGDFGNWLNMPYFNYKNTSRYCINKGLELSLPEFIEHALENSLSLQELSGFSMDPIFETDEDPEFIDAPPCLKSLVAQGFPPGSRNAALFSMGVFARKKFPESWEDKVFEYNQRFMGPGSYSEVVGIIKSLNRKSYTYKCKDQPICSSCNKEVCITTPYGIVISTDDEKNRRPNILETVETPVICFAPDKNSKDEPYWVFTIGDDELEVTVDMARSQSIFSREYLRQFHKVILPIKDAKWVQAINELLAGADIRELAPDAGPEGQLFIHLEEFCTNKARAKAKEELLLGKPWVENGRVYFRSSDVHKYMSQQRFYSFKEREIWPVLRRHGAAHHRYNIKGKMVSCWSLEQFPEQNEGFDPIDIPDETEY